MNTRKKEHYKYKAKAGTKTGKSAKKIKTGAVSRSGEDKSEAGPLKESPLRTGLIILGMHRSGTSAITRVCNLLGCELPNTLLGANESNIIGHWESEVINNLNNEILETEGTNWYGWSEFDPGWFQSPKFDEFRKKAAKIIREEFGDSELFVLKDPRICRIAPFWLRVLEDNQIRPVIIFPLRNPLEVAASLEYRDGFDPEFGHLLWLRNVLDAEFATRNTPRYFTSFDNFMAKWEQEVAEAQTRLQVTFPVGTDKCAGEVAEFLHEDHRHHHKSDGSVIKDGSLSSWLRDSYRILAGWVKDGENRDDYDTLDQIRSEFNNAVQGLSQLIDAGKRASKKTGKQEEKLEKLQSDNVEIREKLTKKIDKQKEQMIKLQVRLDGTAREINKLISDSADKLRKTKSSYGKRLATKDHQLSALQNELNTVRKELRSTVSVQIENSRVISGMKEHVQLLMNDIETLQTRVRYLETNLQNGVERIGEAITKLLDGGKWTGIPGPIRRRIQASILVRSGMFDADWYLSNYQDIAKAGLNPLLHYINYGAAEGRAPNALFADFKSESDSPDKSD